jgi:hypothetical protein
MTGALRGRPFALRRSRCAPRSPAFRPQRFCGRTLLDFDVENSPRQPFRLLAGNPRLPLQSTSRPRRAIETP